MTPFLFQDLGSLYYHYSEFFQKDCLASLHLVVPAGFFLSLLHMSCFMCNIFLCHLILSDLLCLWSLFCRLRIVVLFASGVCSRWVNMVQRLVLKTSPLFCGCHCPVRSRVCSLVVGIEDTRSIYYLFIWLCCVLIVVCGIFLVL